MWILIPIKRFSQAKTRLANQFEAPRRAAIAQALATRVLRAAVGARGVSCVVALTADPQAKQLAESLGASTMPEPAGAWDFNALLTDALGTLTRRGARSLCYLASDLPDVSSASIETLLARHRSAVELAARDSVSIGRAARDGGSNALLFESPLRFELAFGPASAAAHHRNALAAGLQPQYVDLAGISDDLDSSDVPAAQLRALLQGAA